ncbi:MAG: D-tyrosyl-tRNA(Tyr) deacylase [Firmicutes bacterium]|nr:D-tyrosyl-tRNA(Tyr) deacylase [Bacillota bacterium]
MRAVVQRVIESDVTVDGKVTGAIQKGLMVLLGVAEDDTEKDAEYIAGKVAGLRVFEDEEEKMNLSVKDVGGQILAVSQFTLMGDVRKGKRPSFTRAAKPEEADRLYRTFIELLQQQELHVEEGVFQADMLVRIYNDGPVTILLDSKKTF